MTARDNRDDTGVGRMSSGGRGARYELAVTYVDNDAALRRVCAQLAAAPRFALDTEFVGERTLRAGAGADPGGDRRRGGADRLPGGVVAGAVLRRARARRASRRCSHAGQQDLDLFHSLTGGAPAPILDTQVAAALAGYGAQVGYAQLVERLLGVTVDKSETLTDWSRRPLTKAQLAYAVDDVRYLLPACDALKAQLVELGRWEWAVEECRRLERSVRSIPIEPEDAWLRVRGRGSLRARGLVVLRALAEWREEIAKTRNKPRASIVRDEALVEIARKAPTTVDGLRGLRAVHSRDLERHAGDVVAAHRRGARDPARRPGRSRRRRRPRRRPPASSSCCRRCCACAPRRPSIAPTLLATNADLQLLVQRHAAGAAAELPIMQGWRHTIAGERADGAARGTRLGVARSRPPARCGSASGARGDA